MSLRRVVLEIGRGEVYRFKYSSVSDFFSETIFFFLDDTFTGQADRQTDLGISK